MACCLGKIHEPNVDIRKPYTEISGDGTYSGRSYDEQFVEPFVLKNQLPTNQTTAFLTPAFRNIDRTLTVNLKLVGRPVSLYSSTLKLLDAVYNDVLSPVLLLKETIRLLIVIKNENEDRMRQLLRQLESVPDTLPLSSEQILTLLQQHLSSKKVSRLPVLIIAAAYHSVGSMIGEIPRALQSHNAADRQTGAIGDIEIMLVNESNVVTCYEMKDKKVTITDIQNAVTKISTLDYHIQNYIFITTGSIEESVRDFAFTLYEKTAVEFVVLDCIGFARHFLHFFNRSRIKFLDTYQHLLLQEPNGSVDQSLKEAFLVLRRNAESDHAS
ncbi:MAG: restriction endonuclease, SacI family [bacterium]